MEEVLLDHRVRFEASNGRTYGEFIMDEIGSIQMVEGEFCQTLHIRNKPKRLTRDEALVYYSRKLREVWKRGV